VSAPNLPLMRYAAGASLVTFERTRRNESQANGAHRHEGGDHHRRSHADNVMRPIGKARKNLIVIPRRMRSEIVRGSRASRAREQRGYDLGCNVLLNTDTPLMSRRSTVISAVCAWMFTSPKNWNPLKGDKLDRPGGGALKNTT